MELTIGKPVTRWFQLLQNKQKLFENMENSGIICGDLFIGAVIMNANFANFAKLSFWQSWHFATYALCNAGSGKA